MVNRLEQCLAYSSRLTVLTTRGRRCPRNRDAVQRL